MSRFLEEIRLECYMLYAHHNPEVPLADIALALGYDPKNSPVVTSIDATRATVELQNRTSLTDHSERNTNEPENVLVEKKSRKTITLQRKENTLRVS